MNGYIKFTATDNGDKGSIAVETRIHDVSIPDKIRLLDAFADAMKMSREELLMAVMSLPAVQEGKTSIAVDPKAFDKAFGD